MDSFIITRFLMFWCSAFVVGNLVANTILARRVGTKLDAQDFDMMTFQTSIRSMACALEIWLFLAFLPRANKEEGRNSWILRLGQVTLALSVGFFLMIDPMFAIYWRDKSFDQTLARLGQAFSIMTGLGAVGNMILSFISLKTD